MRFVHCIYVCIYKVITQFVMFYIICIEAVYLTRALMATLNYLMVVISVYSPREHKHIFHETVHNMRINERQLACRLHITDLLAGRRLGALNDSRSCLSTLHGGPADLTVNGDVKSARRMPTDLMLDSACNVVSSMIRFGSNLKWYAFYSLMNLFRLFTTLRKNLIF